jgi:hypothetical protein
MNDRLLVEVKKLAVETGRTLTAVIEDALREALARRGKHGQADRVRLSTFRGKGLQQGVDLDDTAALLDLLDKSNAHA